VRFSGGLFLEANFRGPWCVRSHIVPKDFGLGAKADSGLVAFHYILDGRVQVRIGKEAVRHVGPGEIIVLSHNDPHLLGSDVTKPPIDAKPLMRKAEAHEMAVIDFGEGAQLKNRFVCGFLANAMPNDPLLAALPALLVADLRGRPCSEWAETSFRYAAREHASRRPGSRKFSLAFPRCFLSKPCADTLNRCPAMPPAGSRRCVNRRCHALSERCTYAPPISGLPSNWRKKPASRVRLLRRNSLTPLGCLR